MINILIVDDQEIVREGLKMILSLNDEINVIGEAENGEVLMKLLEEKQPDVILMDIRMPVMNGIEATKLVKEKYPNMKIVILTTFNEDEYIFEGLRNGANGYVLKDSGSKEIIASIKTALEGNMLLNPEISSKVINALVSNPKAEAAAHEKTTDELMEVLTPREVEVAKHVKNGESNKEIAALLFVTEGTVKNYVSRILEKLQLKNRSELILYLMGGGLGSEK